MEVRIDLLFDLYKTNRVNPASGPKNPVRKLIQFQCKAIKKNVFCTINYATILA